MSASGKKRHSLGGSHIPKVAGSDAGVNADINMTPMIDVMLVLLIIFMVITPVLGGYTLVLPRASSAEPEPDERIILAIDRQGRYYLEEKPGVILPEDLATALIGLFALRPGDHVLFIKADQEVEYSHFLTAVDAARTAGVARIGAITENVVGLDDSQRR